MKKSTTERPLKMVSLCLIISMFCNLLSAQEIITSIQNSEAKLEYYLDRAMQERQNEKWETLVEEGLLSAMQNWENENIEKLDAADYESEKEKVENYFEKKVSQAYTKWSLNKEKDNLDTQTGILEQRLKTAALAFEYIDSNGNKTRIVNINDSDEAKAQWQKEAAEIISEFEAQLEYDTSLMVSDIVNRNNNIDLNDEETQKIISEFVESQKKLVSEKYAEISQREGNSLLNVVLYDQESLRKASDKEAAMVIAKQLAKETEATTDLEMKNLFDQFEDEIIKGELENFDLQNSDWYSKFETALNESLEKWNEAELSFLQARSEWELNAEQVFTENEAVWQDAFKELDSRKQQWNEKIFNEIEALYVTLQTQRADLENEIATDLNNYYAMLENQRNSNNNLIQMQEAIYNQNRQLMSVSSEGINNWFDHWGEKYNGLYSYWKTEDATLFNTYFGNTSQLTNTDLKINTNFTVDSDGNKIYSESLSVTELKNTITAWNNAYLAMVQREISKQITIVNEYILYDNNTIESYEKEIKYFEDKYRSETSKGQYYQNPSNQYESEARAKYDNYNREKSKIENYKSQIESLKAAINSNIESRTKLQSISLIFKNTPSDDAEILISRITELNQLKEMMGYNNSLFIGNYKDLWNTNDFILGSYDSLFYWAEELEFSTRASNEASVELYKKTGSTLSDSKMDELENQYLKSSALKEYWKEQLDIANAVKEYAENRTSTQETLNETEQKLLNAIEEYNKANKNYLDTVETLERISIGIDLNTSEIEKEREKLAEEQLILEQKRNEYNEALDVYNGLYGSAVEKSINSLIKQLNDSESDNSEEEIYLNEYYTLLAKQISISNKINIDNIKFYNENGNKSDISFEGTLDYFSEFELNEYADLQLSTILDENFNFNVFESKLKNICSENLQILQKQLELYNNQTLNIEQKKQCEIIIEACANDINKIFQKELQKRKIVKAYLDNENIDSYIKNVSTVENTFDFVNLYFIYFQKTGLSEKIDSDTKALFDDINSKSKELTHEQFYDYINLHRNDLTVTRIFNLSDFTDEYVLLFNSEYNKILLNNGYESKDLVEQVKNDYSKYLTSTLNTENEKAKSEIAQIIKTNINTKFSKEELLDYITELNLSSGGLSDVSVSALNLYINELLYKYTYQKEVVCEIDIDSVTKEIEKYREVLAELNNWPAYIQNKSYIKKVLSSEFFQNLDDNSVLKKQIISQAALLFLPEINDLTSVSNIVKNPIFEITEEDTVFSLTGCDYRLYTISDKIKNEIANKIMLLTKTYDIYISTVTQEDVNNYEKLEILRDEYILKEENLKNNKKGIEEIQKQLLLARDEDEINTLNNAIFIYEQNICDLETAFSGFINNDEYYTSKKDEINFELINKNWYLSLLIGKDFLYEDLSSNLFNENGSISKEEISIIEEVNEYLEKEALEIYSDLSHFTKLIGYIQNYNEVIDGNVDDWLDSIDASDEYKIELKKYFDYGYICYPKYYNYDMQQNYNSGLDRYYIDNKISENILSELIEEEYYNEYSKYLKLVYEEQLYNNFEIKNKENFYEETEWINLKNNEIKIENEKIDPDKRCQTLQINFSEIKDENINPELFAKYFTESSDDYDLSDDIDEQLILDDQITSVYNSIYADRNMRKTSISVIKDEMSLLKGMFEDSIEKQLKVNDTLSAYQEQEKIVNTQQNIYYEKINDYQTKCAEYNEYFKTVQSAYNKLEEKRIEKRKCDEIKRWADNQYLHDYKGIYDTEDYATPEEKYESVKDAFEKAEAAYNCISQIKDSRNSSCEKQYEKEYDEYTASFDKYFRAVLLKSEVEQSIKKQEDKLKEAEINVEKARIELINSCEIKPEEIPFTANKYVTAIKGSDGKYHFDINEEGYAENTSELNKYYNEEKSYLYTNENEEAVYVDLAQADAFDWFVQMESRGGDYLEDLVLAAAWLLSQDDACTDSSIKSAQQNAKDDKNAVAILQTLHGMDSAGIYKTGIPMELKLAYDKVCNNAESRENLAKYLLYKDTYLVENNEQLLYRAHNVLCRRSYEHVKDSANSEIIQNSALSVMFGLIAAEFYACVTPLTLWFLVPAVAATVVSVSYAATAFDFATYKNEINNTQNACDNNILARENKVSNLIKNYNDAEANRVAEREKLNLMKYGSKSGQLEIMNYEAFNAAIKESLNNTELYFYNDENEYEKLLSNDYLKEIYDINDKNNNSLESYYNVINENGTEITTVSELLDTLVTKLNVVQQNKEQALKDKTNQLRDKQKADAKAYNDAVSDYMNNKIDYTETQLKSFAEDAWGDNSWCESAYQNKIQKFYNNYLDAKYISASRETEVYVSDVISKIKTSYNQNLISEEKLCKDLRNYKNELILQNFEEEFKQVEAQIEQIMAVADSEWLKAEAKLNASHNTWLSEFASQLKEKRNAWDTNYANFLTEKAEWITTQYVYANNVNSIESLANSGMDISKALTESLTGLSEVNVNNEALNSIKSDLNGYVSSLYSENLLTNLFDIASTAKTSKQSSSNRLLTANSMNLSTMESYFAAIKVQESITDKLKDNAARLAAEQAETQIAKMIEAYMSRIDSENESMRNWEETLVRSVGYEFGSTIKRDAIVDSTFFHTERETQYVHVYQDYVTTIPTVPLTISSNDTSSSIMTKIRNAQSILDQWSERIFGRTDVDENGNKTMKYFYVPHDVAELNNISEYEKNTIKQEDIGVRTDIVSIRDGEFGQYLGFEPEWVESKDIDVSKGREANLKSTEIHGELGKIMLDYQWNEYVRNNGMALFSLPVYDKKLWPDGGIFEAPSLRGICSVVCDIAGSVTGQSWWLGLVDDAVFAALDLGIENKDPTQVALGFAKAAAINTMSFGVGAAGKAVTAAASTIANTALRVGAQALIGAGQSYITSAGAGFINALNYSNGSWSYDIDSAVQNLYSVSTISGAVGGGVTSGLNAYYAADGNGISLNDRVFDVEDIYKATGLAGGLASNVTSLAMGGDATFNLVQIVGRDKNGMVTGSSGALEFSIGASGAKMRFGTGGMNISLSNLKAVAKGIDEAKKVSDWKHDTEKLSTLNGINMVSYGTYSAKERLANKDNLEFQIIADALENNVEIAKAVWGGALGVEYSEMNNAYGSYSKDSNTIKLNSSLLGGGREEAAKLAAVLSHEGTHAAGNRIEGVAHTIANATYDVLNTNFKLNGDENFSQQMIDAIYDERSWNENVGDTDWWLLKKDGNLQKNGSSSLQWEIANNHVIQQYEGLSEEESIVEIFGGKKKVIEILTKHRIKITGKETNKELGILIEKNLMNNENIININSNIVVSDRDWTTINKSFIENETFFINHTIGIKYIKGMNDPRILQINGGAQLTTYAEWYNVLYDTLNKALSTVNSEFPGDPLAYLKKYTTEISGHGLDKPITVSTQISEKLEQSLDNTISEGGTIPPVGYGGGLNIRFVNNANFSELCLSNHSLGYAVDFDPGNNDNYQLQKGEFNLTKNKYFISYIETQGGTVKPKGWEENYLFATLTASFPEFLQKREKFLSEEMSKNISHSGRFNLAKITTEYNDVKNAQNIITQLSTIELTNSENINPCTRFEFDKIFSENMRKNFTWGGDWDVYKDYMHFEKK